MPPCVCCAPHLMFFSATKPRAGPTALLSAGSQKWASVALPFAAGRTASQTSAQHRQTAACARLRNTSCEKRSCWGPYLCGRGPTKKPSQLFSLSEHREWEARTSAWTAAPAPAPASGMTRRCRRCTPPASGRCRRPCVPGQAAGRRGGRLATLALARECAPFPPNLSPVIPRQCTRATSAGVQAAPRLTAAVPQ
jgi:hypothetical protein